MQRFSTGDRVRVDIPDETDPDHDQYHGEHGQVVGVLSDDAGLVSRIRGLLFGRGFWRVLDNHL